MKKVLVTGAGGTIGINVIKQLVDLKDVEVIAMDLKNKKMIKKFKPYASKIEIVYGDINNYELLNVLVREVDIIIHLAGVLPPFAEMKDSLSKMVDYEGTKNLIKAINDNNPKAFLIYASTTCLYGDTLKASVKNDIIVETDNNYAMSKFRAEEKIIENLKNYTIFRLPAVYGNLKTEAPMYHVPTNANMEVITVNDAASAFVIATDFKSKLNKKIFNVTGGEKCRITFKKFMANVLKYHGLSFRYIGTKILIDKNFYSAFYEDSFELENILHFRKYSLQKYWNEVKLNSKKRLFPRILAVPFTIFFRDKKKGK